MNTPPRPRLLRIEHLDHSTLAGRTQSFTGERVRIGRRPDNDVVFDPQADRAVSGYHCEVLRTGEQVVLRDLGSHNGTFLGDEQVTGDRPLTLPADLRLGQNGPVLRIALSDEAPTPTASGGIGEATLERAISSATSNERSRSQRVVLLLVAVIALVGGGIGVAVWRHGERIDREASERTVAQARLSAEMKTDRESASAAQTAWTDLAKHIRGSVFLCVAEDPAKHQSGIGTAFAVGAHGLLATNAHVAEMLREMPTRAVIQNGSGRAFAIKRLAIHPSYNGPLSPDVALIEIDTEHEVLIPLPLADWTELQALEVGTELGTLGYPGELAESYFSQHGKNEDQAFTGAIATFKTGRIGRLTTYELDAGVLTTRKIIQHSASLTGGTSGSPMLTIAGKVVGLNNAGLDSSVLVKAEGVGVSAMRMANPAQIGHAIRVDELRSLMEKPKWFVPANTETPQLAEPRSGVPSP